MTALRYQVIVAEVRARAPSLAGDPLPPHTDSRVTFTAGAYLPGDVDLADLDRMLKAGQVRVVNR